MDINGAHVFVTGGSRGIGRAIAEAFGEAGARVSLSARSASSVSDLAEKLGGTGVGADLAQRSARDGLIAQVEATAGPIDVLVNNAGVERHMHNVDHTIEDIEDVIVTNLIAPADLCRQVVPGMLERGRGHIVNVASMAGTGAFPGLSLYSASKSGLISFGHGLEMDFRGQPIGVTAVEIGTVPTDMLDAIDEPDAYRPTAASFERFDKLRLMTRVPKEDVAKAIVRAVQKNRRSVRLPRRAAAFPFVRGLPQQLLPVLLAGVPKHKDL